MTGNNDAKRIRAVGILLKGDEVLLIHRKNIKEYFVFPGGGVEKGETIEQAVSRELKEETSIKISIAKLLYKHIYDDTTEQYFYLCDYISGEPKLSDNSIENQEMLKGNDYYQPLWVKLSELRNLLVYPLEIRDLLLEDFKNNFSNAVRVFVIKVSELRS
ncbi:MAG: NUDIX domain-containing protein [Patescibacteria group bacterium]